MRKIWRYFLNGLYLFFILLLILTGFSFYRGYQISSGQRNELKLASFEREYAAIIAGYRTVAQSLYDTLIDIPHTTEMISIALEDESRRDEVRQALYQQLLRNYLKFSNYDIRQFHFHLKDNTSFLRFHKPEKFGDDLSDIRSTVVAVNASGQPASGFEEGRILNGYRFVFPIFHELNQVGSVELSLSMKTVVDSMQNLYGRPSRFILSRSVMEEKLFDPEHLPYHSWPLSDSFVLDRGIPEIGFPEKNMTASELESLKTIIEGFPQELQLMPTKNVGDLLIFPIHNYDMEVVAYIISRAESENDMVLKKNLIWTMLLLIFLFIILTLLFYFIARNNRILNQMASYDNLTGTFSRNVLFTRLQQEMERNRRYNTPLSIILFDLDNFKEINDHFGHMAGDTVLKLFARGIMDNFRTTDYLARLGGDEFLLVLPGTNRKGAEISAKHLKEAIHKIAFPEVGVVSCSMGVAEISPEDKSIEHFIDRVDKGLYQSKGEGRDRITVVSANL